MICNWEQPQFVSASISSFPFRMTVGTSVSCLKFVISQEYLITNAHTILTWRNPNLPYCSPPNDLGLIHPSPTLTDLLAYNVANYRPDHWWEPWVGPRARQEIPRAAEPRKPLTKQSAIAKNAAKRPFPDRHRRKPRSLQRNLQSPLRPPQRQRHQSHPRQIRSLHRTGRLFRRPGAPAETRHLLPRHRRRQRRLRQGLSLGERRQALRPRQAPRDQRLRPPLALPGHAQPTA